ncbi:hypothetical protein A4X13_0g8456 [Tilletia indica]|uniref:Uncharacterized protein n=1 Tax=Tilletia indica TaxID=43049 RepID=A0A8T8SFG8_9BASI|nr:hypothetical protein A4X13_0g8456 [Tilletia indica]
MNGLSARCHRHPARQLPGITNIIPAGVPSVTLPGGILPTTGLSGVTDILPTTGIPGLTSLLPTATLPGVTDVNPTGILARVTGSVTLSGGLTGISATASLPIGSVTATVPALSTLLPAVPGALDTGLMGAGITGTSGLGVSESLPIATVSVA